GAPEIAGGKKLEEETVNNGCIERGHDSVSLFLRQRFLDQFAPRRRSAGEITPVALRILESQHLDLEKEAKPRPIRRGGQDFPEIANQVSLILCRGLRGQFLEARLQAGLHLFHDLGDK